MDKIKAIKNYCHSLKLGNLGSNIDQMVLEAEQQSPSYLEFLETLFKSEMMHRQKRDTEKRQKAARLPMCFDLDGYDYSFNNGLERTQLNQLRELHWLEQNYNLLLMGPSGIGKTYIAAGLCYDAVRSGYRSYFHSMESIIRILKTKDITRTAAAEYKRICNANLIVIDDIMLMPVNKNDAIAFFNFINQVYERTSFIITTNKSPKEWVEIIEDEVLVTALLDRILYKCEIIKLEGPSYRIKYRKTFFKLNNQ